MSFLARSLTCKSNHLCTKIRFETEEEKLSEMAYVFLMTFPRMTLHRKLFAVQNREYENDLLINLRT